MHTKPVLSAFQFRQEQNGPISDQVWAATSNSMDVARPLKAEMYRPSGDHRGAYMPELPGMDVAFPVCTSTNISVRGTGIVALATTTQARCCTSNSCHSLGGSMLRFHGRNPQWLCLYSQPL